MAGAGICFQIAADQQNLSFVIAVRRVIKSLLFQRREQRLYVRKLPNGHRQIHDRLGLNRRDGGAAHVLHLHGPIPQNSPKPVHGFRSVGFPAFLMRRQQNHSPFQSQHPSFPLCPYGFLRRYYSTKKRARQNGVVVFEPEL